MSGTDRYSIGKEFRVIVNETTTRILGSKVRVRYLIYSRRFDDIPDIYAATVQLVEVDCGHWILHHIIVDDDDRRKGVATRIVQAIEKEHLTIGAAFCSDEGEAFARSYVTRFGVRPNWQIGKWSPEQMGARRLNLLAGGAA